jgi:hypothetical protein
MAGQATLLAAARSAALGRALVGTFIRVIPALLLPGQVTTHRHSWVAHLQQFRVRRAETTSGAVAIAMRVMDA